MWTVNCTK
uniref:Uncharacterized protein n=1 Tax=Anguilla anguilla TaxID=7936 RepID=A0A0E9TGZ3_ANGAN